MTSAVIPNPAISATIKELYCNHVLCLPGWRTNKEFMEFQLKYGGWTKKFPNTKFHCIDPSLPADGPPHENVQQYLRGNAKQWVVSKRREQGGHDLFGCDESIDYLISHLCGKDCPAEVVAAGGFSGIMGFSQGAAMAFTMTRLLSLNRDERLARHKIKFAVFVCGLLPFDDGIPKDSKYREDLVTFDSVMNIKSFHIIGTKDQLVKPQEILPYFYDPSVIECDTDHRIPHVDIMGDLNVLRDYIF